MSIQVMSSVSLVVHKAFSNKILFDTVMGIHQYTSDVVGLTK
jgi:hypothetical protein